MEDEIEKISVDAYLMGDHVSLIVEEVFKKLRSFTFVISLTNQSLVAMSTLICILKDWNVIDLVYGILILCISHFLVNLPQSTSRKQLSKHHITLRFDKSTKVSFTTVLYAC